MSTNSSSSSCAIIVFDQNGIIVSIDDALQHRFGDTSKSMVGKPVSDFIEFNNAPPPKHWSTLPKTGQAELSISRNESAGVNYELSYLTYDEGERYCLRLLQSLHDPQDTDMLWQAAKMLRVGTWEVNLGTGNLWWSDMTKIIHEVPHDFKPVLEEGIEFYKAGNSRELISKVVGEAIEKGKPFDVRLQLVTAKGRDIWARSVCEPELKNGKVVRLRGTFQDIDEAYRKNLQARKNEASLNRAQRSAKIGSWEWNPDADEVIWSDEMYRILGLDPKDRTNTVKDFMQYVHPEDRSEMERATAEAIKNRTTSMSHYRIITPDGTLKYVQGGGEQLYDEQGNPTAMVGTIQDVTEQVKIQNQLDQFWNSTLELMCIAKTDGYFERINPRWSELLGYSDEELLNRPFVDFVHEDDKEATIAKTAQLSNGEHNMSLVNRYKTKDGNYVTLLWSASVNDDRSKIFATARDITAEIAAKRSLERYSTELEIKNKELEQYAYIASHDLQEPLRTMRSFVDLFNQRMGSELSADGKEYLRFINEAAVQMSDIVFSLLEYSRLGAELHKEWVDVDTLLHEIIEQITPEAATFDIQALPKAFASKNALMLLLLHLIENAIKFVKQGCDPHIEIGGSEDENFSHYFVRDNGIGIRKEQTERIFTIFQRLNKKREYPGVGIGLAHCRKIVALHGGRISVESSPGKGSTFRFTIEKPH